MSLAVVDNAKFLCDPRNITVDVKYNYSGTVTVSFNLNGKSAFNLELRTRTIPKKEKDYYDIVKRVCNMFVNLEEDELYDICDQYMIGLNIHRNIKNVINRSGTTVWSRN